MITTGFPYKEMPKAGFNYTCSGFPNAVDWWGDNFDKMAKNYMKITKSAFLGQNSGGYRGTSQFLR